MNRSEAAGRASAPLPQDEDDDDNDLLEFIMGEDFMQQLMDKFGGPADLTDVSPVVKLPVAVARQVHYHILLSQQEEDEAAGWRCSEDEKLAGELYAQMSQQEGRPLREVMDLNLAQAIYQADFGSLGNESLSAFDKRLLEENFPQVDKEMLHCMYASNNDSFEETVKSLQEALTSHQAIFSDQGRAEREQRLIERAREASLRETSLKDVTDDQRVTGKEENPWSSADPMAEYNAYRQRAEEFRTKRDETRRKSTEAFHNNHRSVAAYYSQQAQQYHRQFEHANGMAAAALVAAHTDCHSPDTLNLHYFRVAEAVTVLDLFLDQHISNLRKGSGGYDRVNVITGRGVHSVRGRPRIKPATTTRLKKRRLRFEEVRNNAGVLLVHLKKEDALSHDLQE